MLTLYLMLLVTHNFMFQIMPYNWPGPKNIKVSKTWVYAYKYTNTSQLING